MRSSFVAHLLFRFLRLILNIHPFLIFNLIDYWQAATSAGKELLSRKFHNSGKFLFSCVYKQSLIWLKTFSKVRFANFTLWSDSLPRGKEFQDDRTWIAFMSSSFIEKIKRNAHMPEAIKPKHVIKSVCRIVMRYFNFVACIILRWSDQPIKPRKTRSRSNESQNCKTSSLKASRRK